MCTEEIHRWFSFLLVLTQGFGLVTPDLFS